MRRGRATRTRSAATLGATTALAFLIATLTPTPATGSTVRTGDDTESRSFPADDSSTFLAPGRSPLTAAAVVAPITERVAATAWHTAGITGAGVKVGVLDFFDAARWSQAQAAGAVPAPAGQFCRTNGVVCTTLGTSGIEHGSAVAEVVHALAPNAAVYLASGDSTTDQAAAFDWFASQGVTVVVRALGATLDGPGDGRGPLDDVAARASDVGITILQSAGNFGGSTAARGGYWRGTWTDADGNGYLDFAPGVELLTMRCGYGLGLRWSDFDLPAAQRSDYDVEVRRAGALVPWSTRDQQAGATPIETLGDPCPPADPADPGAVREVKLAIHRRAPGSGTAGDVLEMFVHNGSFDRWTNVGSAGQPIADSAAPGVLTVGAMDPTGTGAIANGSALGPTNDGRVKPDVAAPTCVETVSYGAGRCFGGTSAAAAVAGGVAALVASSSAAPTAAALRTYLRTSAAVDRGTPGPDSTFGAGELRLPAPPPPVGPVDPPITPVNTRGYWMLTAAGEVHGFGASVVFGDPVARLATDGRTATDLEPTPDGGGYWIVDDRGGVYAYGTAAVRAPVPGAGLDAAGYDPASGERVTSISATPTGKGYWLFTDRGRVGVYGDATFRGDLRALTLNGPVLGSIPTPSGAGYFMVASDGGIFAFGDAPFLGSMGGTPLNSPVRSLVPTASGRGYWLVAGDGGVFAFGDAAFRGSMGGITLNRPVTGMVRYGAGYLMVGADGGIFSFSDEPYLGSLGANPPAAAVIAVAARA